MISLFRWANQFHLTLVKKLISMPQTLLLPLLLPMHCERFLGTHCSMSSSICPVVFKIPLLTYLAYHHSNQTGCNAVSAVASTKTKAPLGQNEWGFYFWSVTDYLIGNTRSTTSGHGNALTHPAAALSPSEKIWNDTRKPELTENRDRAITATLPHAALVTMGRKTGFLVQTIVVDTWKPAKNEPELKNVQNHVDQADQTIHWV